MHTKKRNFRPIILACVMVGFGPLTAQVTVPFNTANLPTDFVGWNNNPVNPELNIKHEGNKPIQWWTDNIQRMLLKQTGSYAINGFNNQVKDGSLLICPDVNSFTAPGPFTRIHLADGIPGLNSEEFVYRDWMENGITMTGNGDGMYVGQRYNEENRTDATITWSDNPGEWRRDRLTFNFVSGTGQDESGCDSPLGLQTMVVQPDENCREAYVGIGDFDAVSETPDERLDVLDGGAKIRQLPTTAYLDDQLEKMVVVDDDGLLHWRPIAALPDNCEWTLISGGAHDLDVYTATGTSSTCPDDNNDVGIGTASPIAKLEVVRKPTTGDEVGAWVKTTTDATYSGANANTYGVRASCEPASTSTGAPFHNGISGLANGATVANYGLFGTASGNVTNTQGNHGVRGQASGSQTCYGVNGYGNGTALNYGVYGLAQASGTTNHGVLGKVQGSGGGDKYGVKGEVLSPSTGFNSYGVHGTAPTTTTNDSYAIYSNGDQYSSTSTIWTNSDSQLKTNVTDVTDALGIINLLHPKTYEFLHEQFPQLNMSHGLMYGLIAQEVADVLPNSVRDVRIPELLDSLGNVVAPTITVKAMAYQVLIPILVGAVKEQTALIQEQETVNNELLARMDQLEQLLTACCQNPIDTDQRNLIDDGTGLWDQGNGDRNLRIQPNPFNEQTTVYYNLEHSGRMQLMANSSDGKQLRVLHEAHMEAGQYQYEWQTADLSSGIYYVTLLLDGEPIVKKAVKVN